VHRHFPFSAHAAINLAGPPFPMEIFAAAIAPQRIDIHHGQRTVALLRNLNPLNEALIVDDIVSIKQVLPYLLPARRVESPQHHHPFHRIVSVAARRPGPDHVGMENRIKRFTSLVSQARVSRFTISRISFSTSALGFMAAVFYDSTSSRSTPPALPGCTNTYLCPPAPVLI